MHSPRNGRPTKEASVEMHGGILLAARDLFLEKGFTTSMDSIAAAAKVSKRTLYLHYPSKEALYYSVLKWLSAYPDAPKSKLARDGNIDEILLEFCSSLLDHYLTPNIQIFAQLIEKERTRFPQIEAANRRQFDIDFTLPLQKFLDERIEAFREIDTHHASRIICGICMSEISRMFAQNEPNNKDGFKAYMAKSIDIFLNGSLQKG